MNILITYASPHGSTAEIAAFISRHLAAYDTDVTLAHADDVDNIKDYDAILIGSAIHSSMWLPSISRFMFRFADTLQTKPVYLFLVCIMVLEDGGLDKVLSQCVWHEAVERLKIPQENIHAFAGRLNWDNISGDEQWILRGNYKGKMLKEIPTGDFRDWAAIATWASEVASQLELQPNLGDKSYTVKDETITTQEVAQLKWPDNPGEAAAI